MNKKILALLLAFAMMFSTITVAFADTAIGAEAEALKIMGVLQGENSLGVTPEYLAKETTRMQAAIMYLRLKGLEEEAMAFTGTDNFADADTMKWAEGKAIMGYLKANPQLGWVGADFGKFEPFTTITVQQYYKVMLEALGYKQNTAEVVGDFAWTEVMEFAASKGLVKVADVEKFTNNDLAIATIEGLKTNVKDGGMTLVVALVEAEMINKDAAVEAGLYEENTAVVESVKALGNTKVLVDFDSAVTKSFAENTANYKVVEEGTTTAVEVKAAVLDGTTQVVLETAAQTAGKAYTLTVGEVSLNFAGVSKVSKAPEIDEVTGTDTNRVVIEFTTAMDLATALDKANYSIAGATVENVAWDDDAERNSVELTTKGLTANKTYKVVVTNVNSIDGVTLKSGSKNFVAKSDSKAPTLDESNTEVMTNTRILVAFEDANELTKESAENVENYTLTAGSGNDELEVVSAKLVENDDEDLLNVELTTAPQKGSQKYVLHVNNIVDTSVLANKMAKEETVNLYGKRADDDKPTVRGIEYVSDKIIQVTFSDSSRLDFASAQDINNYTVNNDIVVEKAAMLDADDADNKVVRLTVSELGADKSYKVTINNVSDEYGNVMDEKTLSKSFNKAEAVAVATISKVIAKAVDTVEIYFTKELDEKTAEDVANYEIDEEIGTPNKATYNNDKKMVTLSTEDMTANKSYEVTVNGVKDIAENVLTNVEAKFVVALDNNDIDAPEIEDVEAVNKNVVRVTFNEPIDVSLVPTITLDTDLNTDGDDTDTDKTNDADAVGTYKVSTDDDDMVLEFYFTANLTDEDVNLSATDAKDLAGNMSTDTYEFSTISDDAEAVELLSWDQTNVTTIELQFSEKVKLQSGVTTISEGGYTFTPSVDADDNTIGYLKSSKVMDADEELEFNMSAIFENYHGLAVTDADDTASDSSKTTVIETGIEDEEVPYIEEVVAVNRNKVEITFSEDMAFEGSYSIKYVDEDGDDKTISGISVSDPDDNKVTLTFGTNLSSKYVYTLVVDNQARDLAGNRVEADAEFDFAGTDVVAIGNYVTGVKVYNGTTIEVQTYSAIAQGSTATVVYTVDGVEYTVPTDTAAVSASNGTAKAFKVTIDKDATATTLPVAAFADGIEYTVRIDGMSSAFEGIVSDDIVIEYNNKATAGDASDDTFDVTYSDMKDGDVVAFIVNDAIVTGGTDTVASEEASVLVSALGSETNASVMVIRGGVVLYFANVELPTE